VDIGLGIMRLLVLLVDNSVLGGSGARAKAGVVVLGDVLVGLLGGGGTGALDGLGNVVGGVLEGVLLETAVCGGEGEGEEGEGEAHLDGLHCKSWFEDWKSGLVWFGLVAVE
jgi:hypothetical protein